MKTTALISADDLDEVTFENRNREYGAYLLRRSYSGNVTYATMVGIFLFLSVFLLSPLIANFLREKKILGPAIPPIIELVPMKLPNIIVEARVPRNTGMIRRIEAFVIPLITNKPEPVEIDIPNLNNQPNPIGTESGTAEPVDSGAGAGVGNEGNAVSLTVAPPALPKDFAEVMPSYEGGLNAMMKFVQKNLKYPHSARMIGAEGKVFVRFVVNTDGSVSDVEVVRGFFNACDQEAVRVIGLLPAWKPGYQNRVPVAVRMILPINFQMTN